jgi:hypothetical protein
MHAKYFDVLEYFRESRMHPQVSQTLKEFQAFDQTYQDLRLYLETLRADNLDADVECELSDEARAALKRAEVRAVYDSLRYLFNLRVRNRDYRAPNLLTYFAFTD